MEAGHTSACSSRAEAAVHKPGAASSLMGLPDFGSPANAPRAGIAGHQQGGCLQGGGRASTSHDGCSLELETPRVLPGGWVAPACLPLPGSNLPRAQTTANNSHSQPVLSATSSDASLLGGISLSSQRSSAALSPSTPSSYSAVVPPGMPPVGTIPGIAEGPAGSAQLAAAPGFGPGNREAVIAASQKCSAKARELLPGQQPAEVLSSWAKGAAAAAGAGQGARRPQLQR